MPTEPVIHLWEPKHPYYGPEAFGEDCTKWHSWAAFFEALGKCDVDLNLVWRWDWLCEEESAEPSTELHLFMCHQRKSRHVEHVIAVRPDDEPGIVAYLAKHWETMQAMWAPFTDAESPNGMEWAMQMRARRIAQLRAELEILTAEGS